MPLLPKGEGWGEGEIIIFNTTDSNANKLRETRIM
ncbi:hypothetical protein MNBD_GAMMA08-3084 [hydrothermal vent metagenome]|uniref:Uncharacterized protein n=1 Tax=hydrothermal vent metagenome TaxID=652676 RepID=A0A3B0XPN6_9ZZZZ